MPVYRVRYREITDPESPWSTYVDTAPTGPQTDGAGRIDTGASLGGSVSVTGLTNGRSYQFSVDRLDGSGNTVTSAAAISAIPNAPVDETVAAGTGSTTTAGSGSTVGGQLATRNGVKGVYITFANASWSAARVYFRPRTDATFPGYADGLGGTGDAPNLTVTRQPFVVTAAAVAGSGDASSACFKVSNTKLFVPFDYATHDIRVAARYNSAALVITLESPTA